VTHTANEVAAAAAIVASAHAEEQEVRILMLEKNIKMMIETSVFQKAMLEHAATQSTALESIAKSLALLAAPTVMVSGAALQPLGEALEQIKDLIPDAEEETEKSPLPDAPIVEQEKIVEETSASTTAQTDTAASTVADAPRTEKAKKFTSEDVREALRQLQAAKGKQAAIDLLAKYSAAKVSDIETKDFSAVVTQAHLLVLA
jgi:hypothetical protein